MEDTVIWTCTYCNTPPSAQSIRICPKCGRKLTPWDISKAPLERKPEWPFEKKNEAEVKGDYIDYSKRFKRQHHD